MAPLTVSNSLAASSSVVSGVVVLRVVHWKGGGGREREKK